MNDYNEMFFNKNYNIIALLPLCDPTKAMALDDVFFSNKTTQVNIDCSHHAMNCGHNGAQKNDHIRLSDCRN